MSNPNLSTKPDQLQVKIVRAQADIARLICLLAPLLLVEARSPADAGQVDCRHAPHQIGDFLARFKITATGKPQQAMTVDALRITASDVPNIPIGWLFVDQYGNRWIQARSVARLRFNNTTAAFRTAVRVTGAAQYFPATISLSVPDMVLDRCDCVTAP